MARYTIEDIISAVQAGEVTEQQAAGDLSRLGKSIRKARRAVRKQN